MCFLKKIHFVNWPNDILCSIIFPSAAFDLAFSDIFPDFCIVGVTAVGGILDLYQNFCLFLFIGNLKNLLFPISWHHGCMWFCCCDFKSALFYFWGKKIQNQTIAISSHACAILKQINSSLNCDSSCCSYSISDVLIFCSESYWLLKMTSQLSLINLPFYIVFTIFINHG